MHAASLNHTFRLVWSDTHQAFIAVAETTKGRGKKSRAGRVLGALRAVALAGLSLTSGVSWADNFVSTVEAGGVQQSQSEWTTVGMETFNSKTSASPLSFTSYFDTRVGNYNLITNISAAVTVGGSFNGTNFGDSGLKYGGAGGVGVYPKNDGTTTINLSTSVNYFGIWISALNAGNVVKVYTDSTSVNPLYTFNAASLATLTGSYTASNPYYGNPNWATLSGQYGNEAYTTNYKPAQTEPFAFVNIYDTNGRFKYITLEGGGFESDNWTVGSYTKISGLNPAAPNIVSSGNAGTNVVSGLGATVNPKFDGGTLKSSTAGTANNDFSITANGGAIDANGTALVFSGVISNDSGATGAMTIKNTGVGGAITFSGVNTYTGATTVDAGGTLKLSGAGAIATSSGLSNAGIFDIQGTTSGASVKSMTGAGGTTLGSKTLTLTTATGTYSGVMSGTGGGLAVSGGSQVLTGINTYTGATSISSGATVALSGNGSIEGSSGLANDGTFNISAKSTGVNMAGITGSGATTLGANTLTLTNASGTYSGVMAGTGGLTLSGGSQTLSGVNTFTGATSISSGATVTLSGTGSVAASSGLSNGGTFSIAGTTSGASINSMTGAGATTLGSKTLTLTTATGDYGGVMAGTGGLTLSGGSQTLSGVNTFTGATSVSSGATMTLSGAGSVAGSSGVSNAGTFSIAGTTSGASVVSMTGAGATTLGSKTLTLSNASGTYSGVIAGTGGGLAVSGGAQTLTGVNTYTGATSISSGATLAFAGSGSIEASSGLVNNGTFDIAGNCNPICTTVTVGRMTGAGTTILGRNGLYINNASGDYGGSINGTGTVFISNGTQIFSGANTHSGGTSVSDGANLQITSAAALGTGVLDLVGSATFSATLSTTADMTLNNVIRVNLDPTFNVASGTTLTLTAPIQDADNPGEIVATGGGTLLLTAANTYSGNTTIDAGSTLALSGNGSIALSGTALVPLANGVFNNGTFKISGTTSRTVSLGKNYTQSSTGNLLMNWNQKLVVPNSASLGGGLKLTNTNSATYVIGRYTLLQATSVSGTFAVFDTSGLSSGYKYQLAYDASNVYLDLLAGGPSTTATQQSLENTGSALKSSFALQNTYLANGLANDCNQFGDNGVCFSAGSQSTSVRGLDNNSASGQIIVAYKIHPNVRLGAYVDQNLSSRSLGAIKLGNNTPAFGLFAAWNERSDATGFEFKASAGQVRKNATVTRGVVADSESGSGSANLNSQGAQAVAKYGFDAAKDILVSPYAGVRYTQLNMGGYTEATAVGVTSPLAYQAMNAHTTTALAGMGTSFKLNPQTMVHASAGLEKDTSAKNGAYSASSSNISGLTAIDLNATSMKTRRTASLAAYYDLGSNQRIGISGIYRQEAYRSAPTTSVFASYTVGL